MSILCLFILFLNRFGLLRKRFGLLKELLTWLDIWSLCILTICNFRYLPVLYPATLKSVGYYVIPSVQKFAFECPSVYLTALHFRSILSIFLPIFFKLCIRVDIRKEWCWIVGGSISSIKSRVMALDCIILCSYTELIFHGWVSCLPAALLLVLYVHCP